MSSSWEQYYNSRKKKEKKEIAPVNNRSTTSTTTTTSNNNSTSSFDEYYERKRAYEEELGTFGQYRTVETTVKAPSTNKKEGNTKEKENNWKDVFDKIGYTAKSFGSGVLSGLSGIFEAGTTEVADNLNKGNKEKDRGITGQLSDMTDALRYIINPTSLMVDTAVKGSKETINILKDKDKNAIEKATGLVNHATSSATDMLIPQKHFFDEAVQTAGYIAPDNTSDNIMDFSNKVTKPVYDLQEKVYEEGQQYGGGTQFLGTTAGTVGRMIPSIATTVLTKNPALGRTVMGLSVKGSSTTEALNKGAELEEAVKIGDTKAMIEVGTDLAFGGINVFGKGALDDIIAKGIDRKVKNEVLNYLAQKGITGIGGELVEETIADVLNVAVDKGTVDPNASYSLIEWGEMAPVTILSTLVINALTGGYGRASYQDNIARMKQNQAQAQGLQEEIAKKQEELNNSQDVREKQIIQETIDGLNEELNEITNAQTITDGKQQRFTYEAQENDSEYKRSVYESAAKHFDNSEETHKFIDAIANMAEERGTIYEFTNTEELKQGNHNVGDNVINGFTQDGKVVINVDSPKALNVIVGHETTHLLEGTKEYDSLKQVAIEYAKSKGDYDTRIEKLTKIYEGTNADIEAELTSDIIGEYLFTDYNFVQELSVKQPTIFEKIKNFISDLVVRFTGTEQEKQLRKLQRTFEKAYKAQGTQTNTDTKYSVSDNQGRTLTKEQQEYFKDSKVRDENGNLVKVYHGTNKAGFTEFNKNVNYFTDNKEVAQTYTGNDGIYEGYVNITNPITVDAKGEIWSKIAVDNISIDGVNDVREFLNTYGASTWKEGGKLRTSTADLVSAIEEAIDEGEIVSDGVIIKNIYDEGGYSDSVGGKLGTDYITFNSNQFKNVDNTKPTTNPDIRYSLSESGKMVDNKGNEVKLEASETGTHGTLMAMHNLSDSKLRGVLELGGFPVPSIAITNPKLDFTNYGEISVIFDKETINPTNKQNEVYGSDVYSPRFPDTVNELIDKGVKQVSDILGMSSSQFEANYEGMSKEEVANRLTRETSVIDRYLESKNITVEPVYKTYSAEQSRVPVKYIENFYNAHQELQNNDINIRELNYDDYSEEIKQIYIDSLVEQGVSIEDAQDLYKDFGKADITKFLIDIKNYKKFSSQGQQQIDTYATKQEKIKHIDFYSDEYRNFVEDLIAPAFGDKYIRNNKDVFTPSGNRRSFKQLHDPYNLENIVKNMKGKVRGEEGFFYGAGNIRSQVTPQFKSIAEIKANEGKLITNAQMEEVKQDINSDLNNLSVTARNFGGHSYDSYEAALNEIAELKKITSDKARNILNDYGFKNVPDILVKKSIEFLEKLKNAPTEYFEAKPQRAVGFDEVEAIVVPNNISAELKQQLYDNGLNVIEYDPNIEGDRQAKINELDEYKFSLSAQNEEIAPTGEWNVYGKDIKYQVEEAIAPLQEKIENLTEQLETVMNSTEQVQEVKPTKPTLEEVQNLMDIKENKSGSEYASAFFELRDKYGQANLYKSLNEYYAKGTVTEENNEFDLAPTSQEVVEKQNEEAFNTITDNDAPSFEDIVDEAMWSEDYESTDNSKVQSPLEDRNIEDVGNRKIKAYQYENPEVRPYFMEEAQNMLYDLDNTIKGEKVAIHDQEGYISEWTGTTRQTTEAIAYLKDNYNYSYEQIRKGLNDIIEDNGKENNAVAKRIEFMLDERLREGYTTSDGYPIPPNQEYIKFLEEKQITEYNKEAFNALTDLDIPLEQATMDVEPKLKASEQVVPIEEKTAQKGNIELSDTSKEEQTAPSVEPPIEPPEEEKIAKILSERPTEANKKQRQWAKFRIAFIDKGSPFEDLALKKNNRELMGKWESTLLSGAEAQEVMQHGAKEIDALNNVENQLSKGLYDIQAEVGDKVQEFSEYLYHKHNVDRMSLESKAQAKLAELQKTIFNGYEIEDIEKLSRRRITEKTNEETAELIETAKEYVRLSETKNKPVFGDSVTAEISQEIVNEYEMNNPEFMDWAKDVYNYNKANLNHLIKNGVVSQETADLFDEMYPNYVPIARANVQGNAINVPLDTNRTGVNAPIARAKGGNQDILPLFDTMARRTLQTYRAAAKNDFGVELKKALNSVVDNQQTNLDEILENVDNQESLLQEGKNGNAPTFTVFEKGEKVTYEITQDMYDALKPVSEGLQGKILWGVPNKISNAFKGVTTEFNIVFALTNPIKDVQDVLMNSQHAAKTYAKIPEATAQIFKKGMWYKEYIANGGGQNSYFDSQDGTFGKESLTDKILPLKAISRLNNFIEMTPRLAEYIASREAGRSKKVAMLDAARVTTNFKAGGDITKWANRNGATFLNASVQGAMQQVRNVREAHANGLKGYANLATKFTLAGVPAMILNAMLWGDDEEYEELSDYVKTNYWIVGKYGDGNFIRIPKGRMVTVIQESFNQMKHLVTGDEQADLNSFLEVLGNNIAPNNPVSDNILSPIVQATTNKTWYGGDLVPTRLQDVPAAEQYDESTDKLSIAIGQATGISPYKINYVLDQYSGGIGDVLLPMMTEQAEGGNDSLGSKLLAPLVNKFTVDSTMKNQNVSDLYDLSDEVTVKANSSNATDKDILQDKYLNAIKTEMNELYKEKREIQNDTSLPDSEKYNKVREIQKQINEMAKQATENYEDITKTSNYAKVADKEYYNKNGTWTKVKEDESSELNSMGMTTDQKSTYFNLKSTISDINGSESENKKAEIATAVMNTNLTDEQKAYIYGKNYSSDETLNMVVKGGIDFNEYLSYASQTIMADKDEDGKSISGTRKTKVINAINALNLSIPQKAMLIRKEYSSFREYNDSIVEYVSSLDIDYSEKVQILNELDMKVDEQGNVYWD